MDAASDSWRKSISHLRDSRSQSLEALRIGNCTLQMFHNPWVAGLPGSRSWGSGVTLTRRLSEGKFDDLALSRLSDVTEKT